MTILISPPLHAKYCWQQSFKIGNISSRTQQYIDSITYSKHKTNQNSLIESDS
jgi:hypothetical protein